MTPDAARSLTRPIRRLALRLRLQTSLRWTFLASAAALCVTAVGVGLFQAWLIPPEALTWFGLAGAALVGLGVLSGLVRRLDRVALAQRVDRANDLKDRLGTALALLNKPATERTEFEQAQIQDALAHAPKATHAAAAPWAFPRELLFVAGGLALAWSAALLHVTPAADAHARVRDVRFDDLPLPAMASTEVVLPPLPPEEKKALEERLQETKDTLAPLTQNDKEAQELVEKLNKALEEAAEGKLSDKQIADRVAELEKQIDELTGNSEAQEKLETAQEVMKDLAEELEKEAEKLAKEEKKDKDKEPEAIKAKEIEEVADLLKKKEFEEAAAKIEELIEKWKKMTPEEQERLMKMFEHLAERFKSDLTKQMEGLKKEQSRLEKKMEKDQKGQKGKQPDKKDESRLEKNKKELEKLEKKQKDQQQGDGGEKSKQLDQLSRDLRDMADEMRRQREQQGQKDQDKDGQKKEGKGQKESQDKDGPADKQARGGNEKSMRRMAEALRKMGQGMQRQKMGQQAKMRTADLRDAMKKKQGQGNTDGRKELEKLAREGLGKEKGGDGDKEKRNLQLGKEKPRQGAEWQRIKTPHDGPLSKDKVPAAEGIGQGTGRPLSAHPTKILEGRLLPDELKGKRGEGPSKKEILYGAAERGTRVPGYGDTQIDYSQRAARQMSDEEIPPGYRVFVEEYFRLIRAR